MHSNYKTIDTNLIHAGEPDPRIKGAVSMPIFQSATFEYAGEGSYNDIRYIRLNNSPNHLALHQKLAAIEGAEDALVTASGMAAISTALLTVLGAGDHLLVQDCLYGGTHDLVTKDFQHLGIAFDFIDGDRPETWESKLRPNSKAIYLESMANPLLKVPDLEAAVQFARKHRLVSIIDNTFASPVNFRPLELGFDLVLHSCSKYMNGHTDIVGGACIGSSDLVTKIRHKLNHMGGCMDPHAAFLLHRGMKTLALRVRYQNSSALELASFLEAHAAVKKVNYPGLPSHKQHERARRLFDGFSGVFSFELVDDSADTADRFMAALKLPICAPSLGGVETLITRPATTSHAGLAPDQRRGLGISDGLIRVSVGIESTRELIDDFAAALESVSAKATARASK